MLRRQLRRALANLGLPPETPLLIGVSGGADSVALLHALVGLGYRPHVCHLNHRWRGPASDADAVFVRALARKLGLPATVAARKAGHTEQAARQARLKFFQRVAHKTGIGTLMLAHTADDQAETVLLRLIRGAGPTGLAGMAPERQLGRLRVVRPLLGVTRAQVLVYLNAHRLRWHEDASNRDTRFLRNRVRHVLLPLLERQFNPAIRSVLCRTAEILRAEQADEPVAAERRAIRRALGQIGFQQVEAVRRRLSAPAPVGGEWSVRVPGSTRIAALGIQLQCRAMAHVAGISRSRSPRKTAEYLDADVLGTGLRLRTWRPGDRFQPLGMQRHKKLQDFFVDQKVPREHRCRIPLLCTANGRIAWVVGYRIAEPFKVTEVTGRVLQVRCTRR